MGNFVDSEGKYHFKIVYPQDGGIYNEWKQTSDPLTNTETVTGFEAVNIHSLGHGFSGLSKSSSTEALFDCDVGGDYDFVIGATLQTQSSIVAFGGGYTPHGTNQVELYIHNPLFNIFLLPKDNYYFRYVPEGFTSTILTDTTSQTVTQYVENPNPNDKLTLKYYVGTDGTNDQLSIQYLINGSWTVLTGVFTPATAGVIYTHESDYAGWPTKLKLYAPSSDGHNYRKLTLNGIIVARKDDVSNDNWANDAAAGFAFDSNSEGNIIEKIWDVPQPNTNWVERDGTNSLPQDIRLDLRFFNLTLAYMSEPVGWVEHPFLLSTIDKCWLDISYNVPNAVFRKGDVGWKIVETGSMLYEGDFDEDDILIDVTEKNIVIVEFYRGSIRSPIWLGDNKCYRLK